MAKRSLLSELSSYIAYSLYYVLWLIIFQFAPKLALYMQTVCAADRPNSTYC